MSEIDDKSKIQTTELPDNRPPLGEYFYTESSPIRSGSLPDAACFVCGITPKPNIIFQHIQAVAQCTSAARRIAALFLVGSCCLSRNASRDGIGLRVNFCKEHRRNAEILIRLTADGIITVQRVIDATCSRISPREFNELVALEARKIWSDQHTHRCHRNWCDAWDVFVRENGHIPSLAERRQYAERLASERSADQAQADWLLAEKNIASLYVVEN